MPPVGQCRNVASWMDELPPNLMDCATFCLISSDVYINYTCWPWTGSRSCGIICKSSGSVISGFLSVMPTSKSVICCTSFRDFSHNMKLLIDEQQNNQQRSGQRYIILHAMGIIQYIDPVFNRKLDWDVFLYLWYKHLMTNRMNECPQARKIALPKSE